MWLVCERACVYMCVFPCLSSVCSLTLYSYFFFFAPFFLPLLALLVSLSLTLSLSPCLLMTQRCAKNFLCSMRTHYCKPISHTEVYTRSRSRTLAAFITLEKWVVSGKKKITSEAEDWD